MSAETQLPPSLRRTPSHGKSTGEEDFLPFHSYHLGWYSGLQFLMELKRQEEKLECFLKVAVFHNLSSV